MPAHIQYTTGTDQDLPLLVRQRHAFRIEEAERRAQLDMSEEIVEKAALVVSVLDPTGFERHLFVGPRLEIRAIVEAGLLRDAFGVLTTHPTKRNAWCGIGRERERRLPQPLMGRRLIRVGMVDLHAELGGSHESGALPDARGQPRCHIGPVLLLVRLFVLVLPAGSNSRQRQTRFVFRRGLAHRPHPPAVVPGDPNRQMA